MLQGGCSCARVAAPRSCCAATATVATVTAAGSAGAWRATPLGARALADINDLGAAGWPTPSARGGGANGAVLGVMAAMAVVAVVVAVVACSRT